MGVSGLCAWAPCLALTLTSPRGKGAVNLCPSADAVVGNGRPWAPCRRSRREGTEGTRLKQLTVYEVCRLS